MIITTLVFILAFAIWNLHIKYAQKNLCDLISNHILKHIIVLSITIINISIVSATIQQYSMQLKSEVFNITPLWVICTIFLFAILLSLKYKLDNIGTASSIFVPIIFSVAATLVITAASKDNLYHIFPILSINYKSLFKRILLMSAMLFELIFLFFMPENPDNKSDYKQIGNRAIFRCYIYYLILSIVFTIMLPDAQAGIYEPFFKIIKHSHIGKTHIKFDSLFLILYCISGFLYVSSMCLMTFETINASLSKIASHITKPLLILWVIIATLIPYISEGIYKIMSEYYFILSFITFGLPVILIMNKVLPCRLKK